MSRRRIGALTFLVALGTGCTCGGDPVPFHAPAEPTFEGQGQLLPLEAHDLDEGTRVFELEGASIRIEDGSMRAAAVYDFDRDGDRDVVLVVVGAANATARVLYAEHEVGGFATPVSLANRGPLDAFGTRCAVVRSWAQALGEQLAVVGFDSQCADAEARLTTQWVLSADERPRALEVFDFRAGAGEGLTFAANDRDQDGHDDLEVTVHVAAEPVVETPLVWMSRASGLAREGEQPEPLLASLSQEARDRLDRSVDDALATASRAIAARETLCREAEAPRLWIGGQRGVPCSAGPSAGRAYAVRAAALARRIRSWPPSLDAFDAAFDAYLALDRIGVTYLDGDRALVRDAWMRAATLRPERFLAHEGPPATPVSVRNEPRASTLAFLDEDHVLIRGSEPRVVTLGDETSVAPAAPERGEARIADAEAGLALTALERRCEGTVAVLTPTVAGEAVTAAREVLVRARPAPVSQPCPLPEGLRADDEGFVALGWAPQGLVLARGRHVLVVPLDATGSPAGRPTALSDDTPMPAPLVAGAALSTAEAYALSLPFGILVVDREHESLALYRDENFALPQGSPADAALAPSRRRIAWLAGGHLRWADLVETDAPVAIPPSLEPPEGASNGEAPTPPPPPPAAIEDARRAGEPQ